VHANKLLHLDIKPANVFISMENNRPVLLDFGAARITLSEEAMKLKPMYTAGFAAPEHYRFRPEELGPWSDIYSVGATMYTCLAGTPPQAGDQREEKDKMIPVRQLARRQYSDDLYDIVESCLQLNWLIRPQTAFELQKRLTEAYPAAATEDRTKHGAYSPAATVEEPGERGLAAAAGRRGAGRAPWTVTAAASPHARSTTAETRSARSAAMVCPLTDDIRDSPLSPSVTTPLAIPTR